MQRKRIKKATLLLCHLMSLAGRQHGKIRLIRAKVVEAFVAVPKVHFVFGVRET